MTFPTKFSERMRAAMFPQQNLKRREAAIANLRATFNFSEGSVTVTRDYKDGHYEELDTQNTSETHEDALEGASEQEQVQEHQ